MQKTKILLVDDHRILREGLRHSLLKEENVVVIGEADTGIAALHFVSEQPPDVIIMDISMPDLNGIEATRQILSMDANIKVIALSMYSDNAYVMGMLNAGASAYLLKSCSSKELLQAIHTVQSGGMYLCEKVTPIVIKNSIKYSQNQDEKKSVFNTLTQRERQVLQLLSEGNKTQTIAQKLFISPKTVNAHTTSIKSKLNIRNIAELTKLAIAEGLTHLEFT